MKHSTLSGLFNWKTLETSLHDRVCVQVSKHTIPPTDPLRGSSNGRLLSKSEKIIEASVELNGLEWEEVWKDSVMFPFWV